MSMPPTNISASDLWLALASKERPSQVVDMPRLNDDGSAIGQIRIRILTQEEQMQCASSAQRTAREHMKDSAKDDLGYERVYSDAYCIEILFRACRDVDDASKPAFPSPKLIRQVLTTEECAMLYQHYLTIQLELGPMAVKMTDADFSAWVARLKEGGSAYPLDSLDSALLKMLVLRMASLLPSSPTDSISVGSPHESARESFAPASSDAEVTS